MKYLRVIFCRRTPDYDEYLLTNDDRTIRVINWGTTTEEHEADGCGKITWELFKEATKLLRGYIATGNIASAHGDFQDLQFRLALAEAYEAGRTN